MQKSDSIGNLAKSLALVQAALTPAKKDSKNPFFKSTYADLTAVWDSCRELLSKNGLSVIQGNSVGLDNTIIVETILAHESGEWIQSELCLPLAKHDPQGVGSALTYGRRYGLAAIVGIVADVDDDGNAASNGGAKPPVKPLKAVEEPTVREGLVLAIQNLGKALNASGDSIKWSGKTTSDYIGEYFGGGVTLDNANEPQLKAIASDLQARLKTLKDTEAQRLVDAEGK